MNEAKHTPGPWEKGKGRDYWTITDATRYPIAEIRIGFPEAEANAYLIAAAPELLEALEAAKIEHRVCGDDYYSCPKSGDHPGYPDVEFASCDCGADQHNDRIARALAKARGEAA